MDKIKNIDGKTVCFVDKNKKTVEIIEKGFKTIITFLPNNTYQIINEKVN